MRLALLFLLLLTTNAKASPLALVYYGPGVCDGCPQSLARTIQKSGFTVQKIYAGQISEQTLSKAAIFAVPGGDNEMDVMKALHPGEADRIRSFVAQGGNYLGVCLGAYLAADYALHLFNGKIHNHSPTIEARMEDVTWSGKHRWLYFQDGPEFTLAAGNNSQIWANYKTGAVAALQQPYGVGKVGLIGPHLEADQSWLDDDHLVDPDGFDDDLMPEFLQMLTTHSSIL